jgi:hypothetical protein
MFGIFFMMDQLEMLTAREQLMEDIEMIIETRIDGDCDGLVKALCDAVCINFPVNHAPVVSSTDRGQDSAFMDDNFGG